MLYIYYSIFNQKFVLLLNIESHIICHIYYSIFNSKISAVITELAGIKKDSNNNIGGIRSESSSS